MILKWNYNMFRELMKKIIDKKYEELNYDKKNKNNIF